MVSGPTLTIIMPTNPFQSPSSDRFRLLNQPTSPKNSIQLNRKKISIKLPSTIGVVKLPEAIEIELQAAQGEVLIDRKPVK